MSLSEIIVNFLIGGLFAFFVITIYELLQGKKKIVMKKWEYDAIVFPWSPQNELDENRGSATKSFCEEINRLGEQGWEIISAQVCGDIRELYILIKREKKEGEQQEFISIPQD